MADQEVVLLLKLVERIGRHAALPQFRAQSPSSAKLIWTFPSFPIRLWDVLGQRLIGKELA